MLDIGISNGKINQKKKNHF